MYVIVLAVTDVLTTGCGKWYAVSVHIAAEVGGDGVAVRSCVPAIYTRELEIGISEAQTTFYSIGAAVAVGIKITEVGDAVIVDIGIAGTKLKVRSGSAGVQVIIVDENGKL